MSATAANPSPFGARAGIVLSVIGTLLLLGLLIVSGFGTEIEQRTVRTPGPAAKGATGFQALHDLLAKLPDTQVTLTRTAPELDTEGLLIVTPDRQTRPKDLTELIAARGHLPTLIILPKWETERDGLSSTRERRTEGGVSSYRATRLVEQFRVVVSGESARVRRPQPFDGLPFAPVEAPQTMMGDPLVPIVRIGSNPVLARISETRTFVLADPDLANNYGMRDVRNARAMVALIEEMNDVTPGEIAFDLTLHYRPGDRNLLKLMFTPPFVAVTIALLAAALLAGWASVARFGPVRREARALPFGKAALLDNIAMLTRSAGKADQGGPRYAAMLAERLGRRLHAPPRLKDGPLAEWLDGVRPGYLERHNAVLNAQDEGDLIAAAQKLDDFTKEKA